MSPTISPAATPAAAKPSPAPAKLRPAAQAAVKAVLAVSLAASSAVAAAPAHAAACSGVCPYDPSYGVIDIIRETPAKDGFRVAGWAVDPDAPTIPVQTVTLKITKNGQDLVSWTTEKVDWNRTDIGSKYPTYGPRHGFDLTFTKGQIAWWPSVSAADRVTVCATAQRGSYQRNLGCADLDKVDKYVGTAVVYDLNNAQLSNQAPTGVFRKKFTNKTNRDQTFAIEASKDVNTSHSWSKTTQVGVGASIEVGGKVGIPEIADVDVKATLSVNGSWTWQSTDTESTTDHYEWSDTVIAESKAVTKYSATVTKATLNVPYRLEGYVLYKGGYRQPEASVAAGTYTGVTTYDLETTTAVFDLNGNPLTQNGQATSPRFLARTTR